MASIGNAQEMIRRPRPEDLGRRPGECRRSLRILVCRRPRGLESRGIAGGTWIAHGVICCHADRIDGFAAEDTASIYAACDVYAMSSITDSFGQTYLEAWLSGRPVIGARVPVIECVIEHGVDGLVVAPRSAPALADALVLADPRRRDAMGAAGRAKTLARFTWDRVTVRVEAAYRETLHQGRRSMARGG